MKRKLFCLLTLLLTVCSGAWAVPTTISSDVIIGPVTYASKTYSLTNGEYISGSWNGGSTAVTIAGTSYSYCIKLENSTELTFITSKAMNVEFRFTGSKLKIDNVATSAATDNVLTINNLEAGTHTIKRNSGTTALYAIIFTSISPAAASAPTKPTITGGPAEAVAKNTAVTLTASSTGLPSPNYQWYSNTTAVATVDAEHEIDGATEASYSPSTAAIGTKYYYVVARNSEGSATSDVVSVEVVGSNACELLSIQFSNSAYGAISSLTAGAGTITVPYLSGESAPTVNESSIVISDNATKVVDGNTVTVTAEDGTTTGIYTITKTAFTPLEVTGDIDTETFTAVPTWVYNPYGWDGDKGVKFAKDDNESGGTRRISLGNTRQYYFISAAQTLTLTSGSAAGKGINVYRNGVKLATPTATASTNNSIDIALDPSAPCMIMIESKGNNGDGGFTKYAVTAAVAKYDVNIAAMTNGNVTADVDEAAEGATVTLTVSPADGYELNTLTVSKAEGTVATSEVDATHYTFTMPAEAVTVAATFSEVVVPVSSDKTFDYSAGDANYKSWSQSPITVETTATGIDSGNKFLKPNNADYTITIKGSAAVITKVVFTFTSTNYVSNSITADDETTADISEAIGTWIPTYGKQSVTFTVDNDNSHKGRLTKIEVTYSKDVTITPANNMSTYVTPAALDFSKVDGLTAYVATGKGTGTVVMSPVTAVPADTPLLLVGTAGTPYSVPVAAEASAPGTNYLKKGPETFTGTEENKYILWTDGKFHLVAAGTLAANKAYLDLDGVGAHELSIVFDDEGETTALSEVRGLKAEVRGEFYDLSGRKVAQPTKGLYIVNGRKVVIK